MSDKRNPRAMSADSKLGSSVSSKYQFTPKNNPNVMTAGPKLESMRNFGELKSRPVIGRDS